MRVAFDPAWLGDLAGMDEMAVEAAACRVAEWLLEDAGHNVEVVADPALAYAQDRMIAEARLGPVVLAAAALRRLWPQVVDALASEED